jgi:protein TonB
MKRKLTLLLAGLLLALISSMNQPLSACEYSSTLLPKDVPATFGNGSLAEFQQWVASNLKYPPQAVEQQIQGRVFVQFIVDKEGKVTNITILKSPHQLLSDEVIRVMNLAPRWNPGIRDGEPAATRYSMPLDFKL